MSEKLGIGHIGIGNHWKQSHRPFLEASPFCETVGVADLQDVSVDAITDFVAQPVLTNNYRELLDDERVDAVVVTTRDGRKCC